MKNISLILLLLCSNFISLVVVAQKHGWQWNNTQWKTDTNATTPTLLFNEDFTDSAFNNLGSGINGNYWYIYGNQGNGGVAFRSPNNRSTFPLALSRRPKLGGDAWAGAGWEAWNDLNGNGIKEDNERTYQRIDKKDDITVLKFRAFSDFAHAINKAGVEVAMLEHRTQLCPPPDFCHDLSFESMQCFYSRMQDPAIQLETNVENTGNITPLGVQRSHYVGNNGRTTLNDLESEYDNLVVWRNKIGTGKTNIEQWGTLNYADYDVNAEMNSKLDSANRFSLFSLVQIALFRNDTNFTLLRSGITRSQAQIGIINCSVGITKKSDFNLDYQINQADANVLVSNWLRNDSITIRTGDANNDGKIDLYDASPLIAFWDADSTTGNVNAKFSYSPNTGEVKISSNQISYFAIRCPSSCLMAASANLQGLNTAQSIVSDTLIGAFTTGTWNINEVSLGNIILPTNLSEISITVNYKNSYVSDGFTLGLDTLLQITQLQEQIMQKQTFYIDNQVAELPYSNAGYHIIISDAMGRILYENSSIQPQNITIQNNGVKILRIADKATGKPLLVKKYVTLR